MAADRVTSGIDAFREAALSCPLPPAVELIGEKWAFLILRGALNGLEHFEQFQARGIEVMCMSVNDPFVMQAWGQSQHVPEALLMLADGNADFTRALGLELDASAYGMGKRSRRFALYAENGTVKKLFVEAPGEFKVSSAEHMLEELGGTA